MKIIEYTQADLDYIWDLAEKRNNPKEANNVKSKKHDDKKSEIQVNYDGLHGELGFSKLSGIPIRTDTSLSGEAPLGRWDFKLVNGKTVEVRYRCKRYYEFALNSDKIEDFVTDYGVLVHPGVKPWTFQITGWCTREQFVKDHHVDNFGFGDRLVIANIKLNKTGWEIFQNQDMFAGIGV